MEQLSIFDLAAGREARDAGMAHTIERHASDMERVTALITALAGTDREPFTSDDLWALIDWDCSPAVVGAAFNALSRRRVITKTGAFTQSQRKNQHATTIFYWRGM